MLSLLHPDPDCRPSVDSIVRSELLLALHRSIRQRKHTAGAISHLDVCSACARMLMGARHMLRSVY